MTQVIKKMLIRLTNKETEQIDRYGYHIISMDKTVEKHSMNRYTYHTISM